MQNQTKSQLADSGTTEVTHKKNSHTLNDSGMDEMEKWLLDIKNLWNKRLDRLDRYLLKMKAERSHDKK
jgi:hypothetical protein